MGGWWHMVYSEVLTTYLRDNGNNFPKHTLLPAKRPQQQQNLFFFFKYAKKKGFLHLKWGGVRLRCVFFCVVACLCLFGRYGASGSTVELFCESRIASTLSTYLSTFWIASPL